jgi:hypothetical protein
VALATNTKKTINSSRNIVYINNSKTARFRLKESQQQQRSNIQPQDGCQQQQEEFTTRTLATAIETIVTSQTSTAEGKSVAAGMQEIVIKAKIKLASAGTPTAHYGHK